MKNHSGPHPIPNPSLASFVVLILSRLLDYGVGTDVEGYMAVSRGLDRFVQPKYFAEILFAAADGKMPWISRVVPQGIMVNSAFVVDIKALENESVLYKDGLGTWIQNCGKVSNYFVWDRHEAMVCLL